MNAWWEAYGTAALYIGAGMICTTLGATFLLCSMFNAIDRNDP